ncbi:putative bifunctional diguanylate cyclase/phosphodiesterase [Paenibacillus graminis]|uniref:putative bifunctional diguanylate cyclase/phosphodiesterase n=1 Tax=Paenibacillus graminis TaxID=189425 RepID=UPI002DB5781F|nr:EAL domain-containing protein [Paenibacillus graminis]MEC0168297.1 EAL domain-containing protein [Paenibacillus graminis]
MLYLELLNMDWLQLALALLANLAACTLIVFGTVPFRTHALGLQRPFTRMKMILLGTATFSASHILIPLSINLPLAPKYYILHLLFTMAGCWAATYFGIWYSSMPRSYPGRHFSISLAIAGTILVFDYLNIIFLFRNHVVWKPALILMTAASALSLCLAILRVLVISNRNREYHVHSKATVPGIVLCAAGLLLIPLLCAFSVLPVGSPAPGSYLHLIPYILSLFISSGLYIIPDAYRDTRQERQNRRIIETEQHYMSLFEYNPDSVLAFDAQGIVTGLNRQAEQLARQFGLELVGRHFSDLFEGEYHALAQHHYRHVLRGKSSTIELELRNPAGDMLTFWLTSLPIVVEAVPVGIYSIIKDITKNKKDQETIRHLAYHDELTGVANRRSFHNLLLEHTEHNGIPAYPFTLFFIDLDRFKRINDLFGHSFGDKVIQQAAGKLKRCLPSSCSIARMGGDEFTVLAPHLRSRTETESLAASIVEEFSHPFEVGNHSVKLSVSVGIARFPEDGLDADSLVKHADTAMYSAKENGSSQYQFYDAERDQTSLERIILENDLEQSLDNDQIRLFYQPKIDIRSGEIVGLEALVRWQHPVLGMIPPLEFIPLAEKSGFIIPLEQWVLRTACTQVKTWEREGRQVVPVAVNVSQIHLMKPDIFQTIMSTIHELDFDTQLLELEITESAMMHNEEHVISILNDLRRAGISVSMDDFGTGYSSLSYLQSLPIGCLKIDRSFVRKITTDTDSRAIAEMIISMAKQLGLTIVAEGVETEEQVALLKEIQCYNAQGFYYSKPVSADEITGIYL